MIRRAYLSDGNFDVFHPVHMLTAVPGNTLFFKRGLTDEPDCAFAPAPRQFPEPLAVSEVARGIIRGVSLEHQVLELRLKCQLRLLQIVVVYSREDLDQAD
jgi:hypothetical protein